MKRKKLVHLLSRGGVIMSKEGNFLVYCVEQYRSAKGLNGKQVADLFNKFRVWDYIYSALKHCTTGDKYIVGRYIDLYG